MTCHPDLVLLENIHPLAVWTLGCSIRTKAFEETADGPRCILFRYSQGNGWWRCEEQFWVERKLFFLPLSLIQCLAFQSRQSHCVVLGCDKAGPHHPWCG